jgi:hypothetical protein
LQSLFYHNKKAKPNMKPILTLVIIALFSTAAWAQQDSSHQRKTNVYDSTNVHKRTIIDSTHIRNQGTNNHQNTRDTAKPQNNVNNNTTTGDKDRNSKWFLGFRVLPTLTSLDFNNPSTGVVETTFVLGWGLSGQVGVNFSDHAGLQGEIMYESLAQQFKEGNEVRTVHLNYVNFPIMLLLHTGYSKPVNFNVAFGPQFGINTGSSVSSAPGTYGDTVHAVLAVKPADVGIAYGFGLDINLGPNSRTKLAIGYRGVFGIVDISDASNNQTTNQYYILQRSFVRTYAAYIGLTFGL